MRAAQVRVIFTLPRQFGAYYARAAALAYVEWFTSFREQDPFSGLCQVSRSTRQLQRNAAVVPVNGLVRPCHLIPKMGQSVDRGWTGGNVYEAANDPYLNAYIDVDMFCISFRIS